MVRFRLRLFNFLLVLAAVAAASLSAPVSAFAFEYLEHSLFGDLGCREAQRRLAPAVAGSAPGDPVVARYIALSLYCPLSWDVPYCADGYKQAEATINTLESSPAESHDYAVTLGDYVALGDHLSDYGPVHGYPRASDHGLVAETLLWMAEDPQGPGGVVEDVGEDACEPSVPVSWPDVSRDINAGLASLDRSGLKGWPRELLLPSRRAEIPDGPRDPATGYSFDNPHYLDLILRNHHHFGEASHAAWLGFHSAAWDVAARSCEEDLSLDSDELEDIASDLDGWRDVDWDDLGPEGRAQKGCQMLRAVVVRQIVRWAHRARPEVLAPVAGVLKGLDLDAPGADPETAAFADRVAAAVMAVVIEGVGLHFLQDNLAGGHVRTDRTARGLGESRYDHDSDGKFGVLATYTTAQGSIDFVSFGDGTLLGPALPTGPCGVVNADPRVVTSCLRQRQRTLMVAATTASLMDWALGGIMYDPEGAPCADLAAPRGFVCRMLPLRSSNEPGLAVRQGQRLEHGTLPLPPPPFGYQSVLVGVGADALGGEVQSAVRLVFLSELDLMANWMTSYNFGLVSGVARDRGDLGAELAYQFHWRWAARFLVNAGPMVFGRLRGFDGHNRFRMGLGPSVGFSMLPEGWIKLPLQLDLSYRLPLVLLNTGSSGLADGVGIDGHFVEVGVGLAYF